MNTISKLLCLGFASFDIICCIFYLFFLSLLSSTPQPHVFNPFLFLHAAAYTLYCWALGLYGTRVLVCASLPKSSPPPSERAPGEWRLHCVPLVRGFPSNQPLYNSFNQRQILVDSRRGKRQAAPASFCQCVCVCLVNCLCHISLDAAAVCVVVVYVLCGLQSLLFECIISEWMFEFVVFIWNISVFWYNDQATLTVICKTRE